MGIDRLKETGNERRGLQFVTVKGVSVSEREGTRPYPSSVLLSLERDAVQIILDVAPSSNAVTAAIPQLSVKGTAAGQNQQRSTYVSIKCVCGFFFQEADIYSIKMCSLRRFNK